MNWIENVNSLICLVLLGLLLPVAAIAKKVVHKGAVLAMTAAVALQLFAPFAGWIPEMGWPSTVLNAALLVFIAVYRHDLWHLAMAKFLPEHPRRRVSDV